MSEAKFRLLEAAALLIWLPVVFGFLNLVSHGHFTVSEFEWGGVCGVVIFGIIDAGRAYADRKERDERMNKDHAA